ncbi:MAG: aminopeptidase P N-terminal domain-containing protein [Blastocatellia bacterium]|nr:aminopeptidase P N-terminal domain-containing protein [Blastocatellia bacterium]
MKLLRILSIALILLSFIILPTSADNSNKNSTSKPMLAEQPVDIYKQRRQKLMEKTKNGIVLIFGETEDGTLGVDAKFRQNDNFMYLTGVEVPGSILLLVPFSHQGAKEWLFIPQRNLMNEQWTGPQPAPGAETAEAFGIEKVVGKEEFEKTFALVLEGTEFKKAGGIVYNSTKCLCPNRVGSRERFNELLPKANPPELLPVAPIINELRMVKSESELALLQRSIDITATAHEDMFKNIKPGVMEYELEGIIIGNFFKGGAQRLAFPCIVGSGINSTVLHYEHNRKKVEDGDLIVVDIGAEYFYYAADITRTYPASGKFTPRQKEVYKLVLDAQTAAVNAFKYGVSTMSDLQDAARQAMRSSQLRDSKGKSLDSYFIHGLGHFLGMYVHDVGDYSRPLPAGAVITIEPGIYIPDEKIGVRIEDDYLVTEKGLVKMTKNIPSDPEEVEKLMAKYREVKK